MNARLGRPAPWSTLDLTRRHPSLDDLLAIVDHADARLPDLSPVNGRQPSAVLAPLYAGEDGPTIILTRRSWGMRSHTGEVSFPGGRHEPSDPDLIATALRETEEEIGLSRDLVEVVGELPRLTTVSSPAAIVPYVGLLTAKPSLTPSALEVDEVLHVPVSELLRPEIYREELWTRDGITTEITFFELEGDTLWGATARVLRSLLERLV